jgi:hypothetical protein
MHAALEVYYKLKSDPDKTKVLSLCRQAIDNHYSDAKISFFDEYRTPDFCYESFLLYVLHYAHESLTPVTRDSNPLIEFSFSLDLATTSFDTSTFSLYGFGVLTDNPELEAAATGSLPLQIKWTGICDMVAEINGENWLIDHKTSSILSADFFEGFNLAMQPVGYLNAIRQAYPDLNLAGFMVNTLVCRKPTKTGKGFEPHRSYHRYPEWLFEEWKSDTIHLIEEFLDNLFRNSFPKKTSWCVGKYGKCAYLDVCTMEPQHRLAILNSDQYVDNSWKPVSH